jgi:hypothetical protein
MQFTYQCANYQLTSPTRQTSSMKTCDKYRGVDIKQWRELFAGVNSYPSQNPKANSPLQATKQLKYRSADIKQWRELFGAINSYALIN